ncbi:MAG: DUF268 domain-containing protein [Alphaproteobacteria bacterium]|nr:DUF268 domain-containing protein [Alphaproteobacteria bacterium]
MTPEHFQGTLKTFVGQEQESHKRFALDEGKMWPIINEDTPSTAFDRHYIYHVAWAARALKRINPLIHYDFSSSLYFIAMVSAWFPVRVCDIRPPSLQLDGLSVQKENLTSISLPDGSLESVSCLHVVEHVGLGRYGDAVDYDGDLKAVHELKRVVRRGGNILFAVPVGRAAEIIFNAHRIYKWENVLEIFGDDFHLVESALVPEQISLGLVYSPDSELLNMQNCACGCFWFRKT